MSLRVALAVAQVAKAEGLVSRELPEDLEAHLAGSMYRPVHPDYLS